MLARDHKLNQLTGQNVYRLRSPSPSSGFFSQISKRRSQFSTTDLVPPADPFDRSPALAGWGDARLLLHDTLWAPGPRRRCRRLCAAGEHGVAGRRSGLRTRPSHRRIH